MPDSKWFDVKTEDGEETAKAQDVAHETAPEAPEGWEDCTDERKVGGYNYLETNGRVYRKKYTG